MAEIPRGESELVGTKRRPRPAWGELPLPSKAGIVVAFGGLGSVFAAACAAASHWLLDIGGLL